MSKSITVEKMKVPNVVYNLNDLLMLKTKVEFAHALHEKFNSGGTHADLIKAQTSFDSACVTYVLHQLEDLNLKAVKG